MSKKYTSRVAANTIIKAALLAGTCDILSAMLYYLIKTGKNPINILKFVASGVFGKAAFTGGTAMEAAGLLFHFLIAFIWTIFFFLIYQHIKFFSKNAVVTGLIYGIFVWIFMNFIIVKMSATPKAPFNWLNSIINMVIIMFAIGLPISIIISKYYRNKKTSSS